MKKIILLVLILAIAMVSLTGCFWDRQSDKVSYNLSKEADSFNVVRQLTVIDCITNEVLFQMTGKLSIEVDATNRQLQIVVEDENGNYQKHFVGLSDNVTYVVEQKNYKDVDNYKYTLTFNPNMILPFGVKSID